MPKPCSKCKNLRIVNQSLTIAGHTFKINVPCPQCKRRAYNRMLKNLKNKH